MSSERWAALAALQLGAVAVRVLAHPLYVEMGLEPVARGCVEVVGDTIVSGVADYRAAASARARQVRVRDRPDLKNEDSAVVAMHQGRDLLPLVKDGLAWGLVYRATKRTIEELPKRNHHNEQIQHRLDHGMSRAVRLRGMWKEVLGCSEAELERYAIALDAPPEVRTTYRAGGLPLSQVIAVVNAGAAIADAVAREIRKGIAPEDAVQRHVPAPDKVRSAKAAIGTFVRSAQRGVKELDGRVGELKYLSRDAREVLAKARGLIDDLLTVPA